MRFAARAMKFERAAKLLALTEYDEPRDVFADYLKGIALTPNGEASLL